MHLNLAITEQVWDGHEERFGIVIERLKTVQSLDIYLRRHTVNSNVIGGIVRIAKICRDGGVPVQFMCETNREERSLVAVGLNRLGTIILPVLDLPPPGERVDL